MRSPRRLDPERLCSVLVVVLLLLAVLLLASQPPLDPPAPPDDACARLGLQRERVAALASRGRAPRGDVAALDARLAADCGR